MRKEIEKQGIRRLRRRTALAQAASLLVGLLGLGCICVYLQPEFFGVSTPQSTMHGWLVVWLLMGLGLLASSCLLFTVVTQWTRRLLWIRENVAPSMMKLWVEIDETMDITAFHARLGPVDGKRGATWRMRLWATPRGIERFANTPLLARVYFDPETGRPAVVDFDCGILWSLAGEGSAIRTPEEQTPYVSR